MYCLEVVSNVPRGASSYYSLCVRQPYVVGRTEACDIVLQTQDVSRVHATLQVVPAASVAYSYTRGSPGRAVQDTPLFESLPVDGAEPGAPPLSLVLVNKSKFGVAVDGAVIDGSCVVPHGGIVCFGSIGMRATYRPVILSVNPACYDVDHRTELEEMLRQLGATIIPAPGTEVTLLASMNAAYGAGELRQSKRDAAGISMAQSSITSVSGLKPIEASTSVTPTTRDAGDFPNAPNGGINTGSNTPRSRDLNATQTQSLQQNPPAVRPIVLLYVTELIDGSDATVAALQRGHSVVLPSYPFELFAALADQCSQPLHKLPKPADFEPAKSASLYNGLTYMRPEARTVPFSLFGASVSPSAGKRHGGRDDHTRSRAGLLYHRMFTIRDAALCEKLVAVIRGCGGVVVPWGGAVDITQYDEYGDDDPNELPRDDDEDFYESVGLARGSASPSRKDDPIFNSRRTLLHRFKDRRYAVATNTEMGLIKDDTGDGESALRDEWITLARNGWVVITYECILRALLSNKFAPAPVMPTDPHVYNNPLLARHDHDADDAAHHQNDAGHNDDDGMADDLAAAVGIRAKEIDSDATPSDLGSDAGGPVKKLLRRIAERQGQEDAQKHLVYGLTKRGGVDAAAAATAAMQKQGIDSGEVDRVQTWVAGQAAGVSARAAVAFDMQLHRTQVMIDRTVLVCKDRIAEIKRTMAAALEGPAASSGPRHGSKVQYSDPRRQLGASQVPAASHPATLGFLRNVADKCNELLQQIEQMSQTAEGAARTLALQSQWDTCVSVRDSAVQAFDVLTGRESSPGRFPAAAQSRPDGRAPPPAVGRRAASPSYFRGKVNVGDRHLMPPSGSSVGSGSGRPNAVPRSMSVSGAASRRSLAGTAAAAPLQIRHPADTGLRPRTGTATPTATTAGHGFANRRTAADNAYLASSQSASVVAPLPTQTAGLRDRTRWARYLPPPPVQALTTPAPAGNEGAAGGGHGSGGGRKTHSALLIHISPMDLPRIAKHRRLFVTKFGSQEGEIRFNMWLSSQTPPWTSAFVQALHEEEMTLETFIRGSG